MTLDRFHKFGRSNFLIYIWGISPRRGTPLLAVLWLPNKTDIEFGLLIRILFFKCKVCISDDRLV